MHVSSDVIYSEICDIYFLGFADVSHLQIGMVSSILAYKFGSTFAWITSLSVATYIAFTLAVTQVQTQYYAVRPICPQDVIVASTIQFDVVMWSLNMFYPISHWFLFLKKINYDSGGLSSEWPWIKLTMLPVRWQLTLFWIMRSPHDCPLLQFTYLTLFILVVTIYWVFPLNGVQTVKYFNNEQFEVEKYDKYLRSECIYALNLGWKKCHCRVNVCNQMLL